MLTQNFLQFKSWAHLVLDCLDDLVVGGEDDGDGDYKAECIYVGNVGDVVHGVSARPVPFHSTTKASNKMKNILEVIQS